MSPCQRTEVSEHDGAHLSRPGPKRPTRERLVWASSEEVCPPWPQTHAPCSGDGKVSATQATQPYWQKELARKWESHGTDGKEVSDFFPPILGKMNYYFFF